MALHGFLCKFGCAPIPLNCTTSNVSTVVSEDGKVSDERLKTKGPKMVAQLTWYAHALKDAKLVKEVPN
jgi:hypothetical protein